MSIPGLKRVSTPDRAIASSYFVILATEWPESRSIDWREMAHRVRRPVVFDGRNALDAGMLRECGWQVIRIGLGVPQK